MNRLLAGLRVLALENYLAGPFGSMILGDLGAEVIKIEPPQGDKSRATEGPSHHGESQHYLSFNRNKKSLVLDLWTQSGREAFCELVKQSDVVWDNYRPGVMERLGADYESLKKINPRIVSCSITGFGSSGPYRDWQNFDVLAAAMSGILSVTGEPGRPPVRPGPAICDAAGALNGVIGVLAGLVARERVGTGCRVEVPLFSSALSLMGYFITRYALSGVVPGPQGTRYPAVAPYGAYRAKDGYLILGPCWPRIARVIDAEWLLDDPRFQTLESRVQHQEELATILEERLQALPVKDWLELLGAEDIGSGPVYSVDQVLEDPQVQHLNMVIEVNHPLGGKVKLAGNPIMIPGIECEYVAPPTLNQHSDEILRQLLGYSDEKIRLLRDEQETHSEETESHVIKRK